jgi:hypothetical protein
MDGDHITARRRPLRVASLALAACLIEARLASAGPLLLVGAHCSAPLKLAGSAGVVFPIWHQAPPGQAEPMIEHAGVLLEGTVGQGGGRLSLGAAVHASEGLFLNYGLDLSATLTRTSHAPRHAAPVSTYGGLSAGLTLSLVHVSAGFERRVAGPDGSHKTNFTWSIGGQIPFSW